MRSETETKLRDVEQALKGQQAKSKQLINGLQKQVEEQSKARVRFLYPWCCAQWLNGRALDAKTEGPWGGALLASLRCVLEQEH